MGRKTALRNEIHSGSNVKQNLAETNLGVGYQKG
jgi:hypothetical protein